MCHTTMTPRGIKLQLHLHLMALSTYNVNITPAQPPPIWATFKSPHLPNQTLPPPQLLQVLHQTLLPYKAFISSKIIEMRSMIIVCVLLVVFGRGIEAAGGSVGDQCAKNFEKVTTCLTFATGKAETPTKDCCGAVTDIKDSNPVCLCYIIEQIHNGTNPQLKSMGIQEARLLQLPSACKLANANSTDCPKLLHLAPNSPDASVFTNISASITPSAPSGTSLPTTSTTSSNGIKQGPQIAGSLAMVMAIFFSAFCT